MTGNTKAEERAQLWSQTHKRIFFATPQTFRNDVVRGRDTLQPQSNLCANLEHHFGGSELVWATEFNLM